MSDPDGHHLDENDMIILDDEPPPPSLARRPLSSSDHHPHHNRDVVNASSVQVAVRIRPLLATEADSDECIRSIKPQHQQPQQQSNHKNSDKPPPPPPTALQIGGIQGPIFTFDCVLDASLKQDIVYQSIAVPLVESCLQGYNATIVAYGQTGSGKTYTILGTSPHDRTEAGILPRAIHSLFDRLADNAQVKLQFLELYGEEIRDLLGQPNHQHRLAIRDRGGDDDEPEVTGATQLIVQTANEALLALTHGMVRRVTGATAMNQTSSRSHAILSLLIEQQEEIVTSDGTAAEEIVLQVKRSKFHFVDLAGSERLKRTQAEGKRLKEGIDINKGLLVLGNVISALGDVQKRGSFVPYRDSKLTRLLKGSLGGNHKTLMIACVSPSSYNLEESLNCLRYANRAKNIQNKAIVNVDPSSKLLSQLQSQVVLLASDLLKTWQGGNVEGMNFTIESLQALASGDEKASLARGVSPAAAAPVVMAVPRPTVAPAVVASQQQQQQQQSLEQYRKLEMELLRAHDQLKESQSYHDAAEEQLYVVKAEKELYEMQLSVLSENKKEVLDTLPKEVFLEKAKSYESEIGRLKRALQEAEAKSRVMDWMNVDEDKAILQAKKLLDEDRQRFVKLQNVRDELASFETDEAVEAGAVEKEEKDDEAKLGNLTKKYLEEEDDSDHDGDNEEEDQQSQHTETTSAMDRQRRHLQADLIELSRSIAAKEDLIDQLRLSQDKYASMRDFYEERLKHMEVALSEKESEREHLIEKLKLSKGDSEGNLALHERLREKEDHIAGLRKKHKEMMDLTKSSSQNHSRITQLQNEIKGMKKRKVDLQKQLGQERRQHASEKKQLEKAALQKEREANKWKKVSTEREVQAEKASQVAKARLEEIGHLRNKYKDAEKKFRVLSLKRGVMAKAGLDPVIVGRREWNRENETRKFRGAAQPAMVDSLRDLFDQKVAEVVRKEAIVDKLAHEWEEHFELNTRKEELVEAGVDEIEDLVIQIQFKEDRIRQLAQRLGKPQESSSAKSIAATAESDSFLFDQDFNKICSGSQAELSKRTAALVLFGMVVRERRRVAALARTASTLDERAQSAEKTAEANQEALRSYMNEQRRELAALTQSQQEQILSLMDFVKDSSEGNSGPTGLETTGRGFGPKLLVLANERIALLEKQIAEMRLEVQTIDSYRSQIDELNAVVKGKVNEYESLQEDLSGFRSVLRQIRELVVNHGHGEQRDVDHANAAVLEIINDTLHPRKPVASKSKKRAPTGPVSRVPRRILSPRVKKHVELMHTSDSGEDATEADWANEIMTDLALIAEGKVPPSLQGSVKFEDVDSKTDAGAKSPDHQSRQDVSAASQSPGNKATRRAMQLEISAKLEQIALPDNDKVDPLLGRVPDESLVTPPALAPATASAMTTADKDYKSVFDRLMSPSHFTGTQKERFQSRSKKGRQTQPKDAASRLLDDLLQSDSETARQNSSDRGTNSKHLAFSDYTQQDVFERLQRTTTQAYAVKHNGTMFPDPSVFDRDSAFQASPARASHRDHNDSAYSFSTGQLPPMPERPTISGYTSQDVFERLQKTTTEAYAHKTNSGGVRQDH